MKERPVLFTPENIRRIQLGQKWQTRRVIEPQPTTQLYHIQGTEMFAPPTAQDADVPDHRNAVRCPYGVPGDRLWVRESLYEEGGIWYYRADNAAVLVDPAREAESVAWAHHKATSHASAIHMPRFAARLFLDITAVRVERIQDISYDDMRAEGVRPEHETSLLWRESLAGRFRLLWDDINGEKGRGWEVNPWVWVLTFERAAVTEGKQP